MAKSDRHKGKIFLKFFDCLMISKSERRAYPKNLDTTALDISVCFTSIFLPKIFTWLFHHAVSNASL